MCFDIGLCQNSTFRPKVAYHGQRKWPFCRSLKLETKIYCHAYESCSAFLSGKNIQIVCLLRWKKIQEKCVVGHNIAPKLIFSPQNEQFWLIFDSKKHFCAKMAGAMTLKFSGIDSQLFFQHITAFGAPRQFLGSMYLILKFFHDNREKCTISTFLNLKRLRLRQSCV